MESSRELPTGIVTFLLTDIEGSTRLWENEPEAMREALARHDSVVGAYVRRLGGHVVKSKGEGDSVFAVFSHARDAAATAVVLQCALSEEKWPTTRPIRVRMAMHTGQIELRDGDYYGPTVNRCARLRSIAQGGQILVSGVTAQLIQGQLPSGASLRDLGTHHLKDLSAPERVWQLTHPRMAQAAAATAASTPKPSASTGSHRAYLLTDHLNRSADGREWDEGTKHSVTDDAVEHEQDARPIRCYVSPNTAALMNALEERVRIPRLWAATVDAEPQPGAATVECHEATALRQVDLPALAGKQHAKFAVLCAQAAYAGALDAEFSDWAAGWLAGSDNSGVTARELGDRLEDEARRGIGLTNPQDLMLANAARAAAHASRLSWLVGRARDEENTRAIECAAEAVRTAMRLTQLDVVALADQAVGQATLAGPVAPIRPTATIAHNRILSALPT